MTRGNPQLLVRLDTVTLGRVEAAARKYGITRQAVVRAALDDWLATEGPPPPAADDPNQLTIHDPETPA